MSQIIIKNVIKKIKNSVVLDNINILFDSKKIYGIQGANGSGKTMLLRCIAGLMKPTSGTIMYDSHELYKDIDFIPKLGIIIENIGLYPEFDAFTNLKNIAKIKNICTDDDIINSMLAVGLSSKDKRKVKKFSLGMKQKLSIAQAFMEKPAVLLLDEPTNALDNEAVKKFILLCKEAAHNGSIVIIASHDKELIENLCDIKITIDKGMIISEVS